MTVLGRAGCPLQRPPQCRHHARRSTRRRSASRPARGCKAGSAAIRLGDRPAQHDRLAEIAVEDVAEPDQILLDQRLVEPVFGASSAGPVLGDEPTCMRLSIGSPGTRCTTRKMINDIDEEHRDEHQQSLAAVYLTIIPAPRSSGRVPAADYGITSMSRWSATVGSAAADLVRAAHRLRVEGDVAAPAGRSARTGTATGCIS